MENAFSNVYDQQGVTHIVIIVDTYKGMFPYTLSLEKKGFKFSPNKCQKWPVRFEWLQRLVRPQQQELHREEHGWNRLSGKHPPSQRECNIFDQEQ